MKWNWVDIAKGIIILSVAGYHATLGLMTNFLTTWVMPFFFVMSGYLLNVEKWTAPERHFVRNRFQRIMVPYFVSYGLYFLIWWAEGEVGILQLKARLPLDVLLGIFYGNGNTDWMLVTPMWFLPCLFVAEVLYMEGILKRVKGDIPRAGLCAGIAAAGYFIGRMVSLPWGADIAMVIQPFLFAGYLLRKYHIMPAGGKWACVCLAILLLSFAVNDSVDVNGRYYKNLLIFYCGGLAGTLLTFQVSSLLDQIPSLNRLNRFLMVCGQWTLFLLIVHGLVEVRIAQLGLYLAGLPVDAEIRGISKYAWPYAVIAFPAGIGIPLFLIKQFRETRFMRLFCANGILAKK